MVSKKINIYYSLYIFISIIYVIIIKNITNILKQYYAIVIPILILMLVIIGLIIPILNKKILIIIYIIYLFVFLFFRKTKTGFNFEFYLIEWLKNILNNKTILTNILGNIILFIPLGIILYKNISLSILIIIIIELLQVITKRGMFDIVDVVLNVYGIIIGKIGAILWMKIITKTMVKRK